MLGHSIDKFNCFDLQAKPLIWVEAQVERHSKSRIEIMVKARSQFKERRYYYYLFIVYSFPFLHKNLGKKCGGLWFWLPFNHVFIILCVKFVNVALTSLLTSR